MQVRFDFDLTSEEYVSQEAWKKASLPHGCPLHPEGGCGVQRHGTYKRTKPEGAKIARWYCRVGHATVSALPDCLASHLSGSLADVEAVVDAVEQGSSVEKTAEGLRPGIELPGAVRWTRRRVGAVRALLTMLIGLMPTLFRRCDATLASFRKTLGTPDVLVTLRPVASKHLDGLPTPVGFGFGHHARRDRGHQQSAGPDPPADSDDAGC